MLACRIRLPRRGGSHRGDGRRNARSRSPDYKFWFKVENLKLMSGTYDVNVSSNKISNFKNTNADIEYFIALEPESYYG